MQINNSISLNQSPYLNVNHALNNISTGSRLNSASDDSASLSISSNLQSHSSGYSQALSNVNSAVAFTQIGDSSINEQSKLLDTIKEKLLQASTDTTSSDGRELILKDIQKLAQNIDQIASSTNYNGKYILQENEDSQAASTALQIQSGEDSADIIETSSIQSNTLGLDLSSIFSETGASFDSSTARSYLDKVDSALDTLNEFRSELGSSQNQFESTGRSLQSMYTQTQEANSILSSSDIAKEIGNFSKANILSQIGLLTLAQGNNINQNAVSRLLV